MRKLRIQRGLILKAWLSEMNTASCQSRRKMPDKGVLSWRKILKKSQKKMKSFMKNLRSLKTNNHCRMRIRSSLPTRCTSLLKSQDHQWLSLQIIVEVNVGREKILQRSIAESIVRQVASLEDLIWVIKMFQVIASLGSTEVVLISCRKETKIFYLETALPASDQTVLMHKEVQGIVSQHLGSQKEDQITCRTSTLLRDLPKLLLRKWTHHLKAELPCSSTMVIRCSRQTTNLPTNKQKR